jgi:hypothetical protein
VCYCVVIQTHRPCHCLSDYRRTHDASSVDADVLHANVLDAFCAVTENVVRYGGPEATDLQANAAIVTANITPHLDMCRPRGAEERQLMKWFLRTHKLLTLGKAREN